MKYVLIFVALVSMMGCQSTKNARGVAQTTPDVQVRILPLDSTLTFRNHVTFYPGANQSPIIEMGDRTTPSNGTLYCKFTLTGSAPISAPARNQARRIQAGQQYRVQSASAAPSYSINTDGNVVLNRQAPIPVTYTLKNTSTGALFSMACDVVPMVAGVKGQAPSQISGTASEFLNFPGLTISYGQGSSVLNLSAEGQILPIKYDQPMNQQDSGTAI